MTDAPQTEPRRSLNEPGCTTIREVLARVGDKWSVFVITLLGERTMRFTELQRSIEGISQRMLTLTLRQLERDGLVERVVYPVVPPRVEYSLTAARHDVARPARSDGALGRRPPSRHRGRARGVRRPPGVEPYAVAGTREVARSGTMPDGRCCAGI